MAKITVFLLSSFRFALRGRGGAHGYGLPSDRVSLFGLLISSCETNVNTICIITSESEIS